MANEQTAFVLKQAKWSQYLARSSAWLFALILLIILSPLFVVIGILIKLESKGSIFFTQVRGGLNGQYFTIYKFRTMYDEPEKLSLDIDVVENDPRITKVGYILRTTSLDELPQLINIVKGDMAFVGPRPTMPSQTDNYNEYQKQRLFVKPGVTGLAQISGRNALTWDEKIDLDVEYINRKNIRYDLYIILQTFFKVIKSEGVYSNE
ncbi:sugar transferase [Planococcus shenhongbingii]|uniref:Sugar transferase n=1 Tax=Planococcus shenhongbingii TaxID=3058398 RepID=A0ABT8N9H4_9BACL|nr:sugar transferase [Planococcus sp. N017]MDN7244541.1 sugar transferase [Planococcus sp. N017]